MAFESIFDEANNDNKLINMVNLKLPINKTKKCTRRITFSDKVVVDVNEDLNKLIQEQYEIDKNLFNERFGIDLDNIENLPSQLICCDFNNNNINNNNHNCKRIGKCFNCQKKKKTITSKHQRAFRPYNNNNNEINYASKFYFCSFYLLK